jgi:hypothetical protein
MLVVDAVRDSYRARWGKPARTTRFGGDKVVKIAVEILKWDSTSNPEGMTLYATVGASAWPLAGRPPSERIELFVGLAPERDKIAGALAALSLYPAREGVTLDHGHTVPSDGPLWPGSAMSSFLVVRARPGFLPPLELPDGIRVEFLQVIPIYECERAYKKAEGVDALIDCWTEARTLFWDPDRPPNPVCLARSGLGAKTFLGV